MTSRAPAKKNHIENILVKGPKKTTVNFCAIMTYLWKLINVSNHSSLVLVPLTFEKLRRICSPLPLFVNFQVLEFGTIWSLFSFDSCCLTTVSNLSSLVGFNLASLQFLIFHHFSTELWDVNKENFSKTLHAFGDTKFTQFSGKVPSRL